ncbi:MAG: hypothetical protein JSS41_04025 [Proteobacteria bacterium]|nr:hypothetical protein [Pseudomonadota bacterium]MBS0463989.1 hypothetical protein [Pseudomonadota bacterium]
MVINRIPTYDTHAVDGMLSWFAEMSSRGLLFHPEDDPADIIDIATGECTFTHAEAGRVRGILGAMRAAHGDAMIEVCYPVFMRAAGQRLDA